MLEDAMEDFVGRVRSATNDEGRAQGARQLFAALAAEFRQVTPDGRFSNIHPSPGMFKRTMTLVATKIQRTTNSPKPSDKLAGLAMLKALIDLPGEETRHKLRRTYNGIRAVLLAASDVESISKAADLLGFYAKRESGAVFARGVTAELVKAFERLEHRGVGKKHSLIRVAGVIVIGEVVSAAPNLVFTHHADFFTSFWNVACDAEHKVRERAVASLKAVIEVACHRRANRTKTISTRLLNQASEWLRPEASSSEQIHGSLLALREILNPNFIHPLTDAEYVELCRMALNYTTHSDWAIRSALASLIPQLASCRPDIFSQEGLPHAFTFFETEISQHSNDRNEASLRALGELAKAVDSEAFGPYVERAARILRQSLVAGQDGHDEHNCIVLSSIGLISKPAAESRSLSDASRLFAKMLDPMFMVGLGPALAESLQMIVRQIGPLWAAVLERVMSNGAEILGRRQNPQLKNRRVVLALRGLSQYDYSRVSPEILCSFLEEYVRPQLASESSITRSCAVQLSLRLLKSAALWHTSNDGRLCKDVSRLLVPIVDIAVADVHVGTRREAIEGLAADPEAFDDYLAQPERLRVLFFCLYDEELAVKEKAVSLVARLSKTNPAHALPALRKYLMRLMVALRCEGDALRRQRSHGAELLSLLIRDSPRLVLPYVHPIVTLLIARLEEAKLTGDADSATPILHAVSDLGQQRASNLKPHVEQLMPLVVGCLKVKTAGKEFQIASLRALAKLVQNTSCVIDPYHQYPTLMASVLDYLKFSVSREVRVEAQGLLGTLGAVDPSLLEDDVFSDYATRSYRDGDPDFDERYGMHGSHGSFRGTRLGSLNSSTGAVWPELYQANGAARVEPSVPKNDVAADSSPREAPTVLTPQKPEVPNLVSLLPHPYSPNPQYFPSAALDALHSILLDFRLHEYHQEALSAMSSIMTSLGPKCVQFLSTSLPIVGWLLRSGDGSGNRSTEFKEMAFRQLGEIVTVAQQHIKAFVPEIEALVQPYWDADPKLAKSVAELVGSLCIALGDEFRPLVEKFLPSMLGVLAAANRTGDAAVCQVLNTIGIFGNQLEEHIALALPVILSVADDKVISIETRKLSIRTLKKLSYLLPVTGLGSSIVHPLLRMSSTSAGLLSETSQALRIIKEQLGVDFEIFHPTVRSMIRKRFNGGDEGVLMLQSLLDQSGLEKIRSAVEQVDTANTGEHQRERSAGEPTLNVDHAALRLAWETSRHDTEQDWEAWMQALGHAMFQQSGSPALRSCGSLAERYQPLWRELFNPVFLSVYQMLTAETQKSFVTSLETAMQSDTFPASSIQTVLSLTEFLEHDERPMPMKNDLLAKISFKVGAYAKSLRWKEMQHSCGDDDVSCEGEDGLLSIYAALGHKESAAGTLVVAGNQAQVNKEDWFEKLQQWDEALTLHTNAVKESKQATMAAECSTSSFPRSSMSGLPVVKLSEGEEWNHRLAAIRCMNNLGKWTEMEQACLSLWNESTDRPAHLKELLSRSGAAEVALNLCKWTEFEERLQFLPPDQYTTHLYRALLHTRKRNFEEAESNIDSAQRLLDKQLTTTVSEGYQRAYHESLKTQHLIELQEAVSILRDQSSYNSVQEMNITWKKRLRGIKREYLTWHRTLQVRSSLMDSKDNMDEWLVFADICRTAKRLPMAAEALRVLVPEHIADIWSTDSSNLTSEDWSQVDKRVVLSYAKYSWDSGNRLGAFDLLKANQFDEIPDTALGHTKGRYHLALAGWAKKLRESTVGYEVEHFDESLSSTSILEHALEATKADSKSYKAWHAWAYFNDEEATQRSRSDNRDSLAQAHRSPGSFAVLAIDGYFKAMQVAGRRSHLQDTLRLLTLWFKFGMEPKVHEVIEHGCEQTDLNLWLEVLPQMIARLQNPVLQVRQSLKALLIRIGDAYPQALVYPVTVAAKSIHPVRRESAIDILSALRTRRNELVNQAEVASRELVRTAILWQEMWHEGLEECSRLYFGEKNIRGMYETVQPLHEMMVKGPETLREANFVREYGRELGDASRWLDEYNANPEHVPEQELTAAWDCYFTIFRKITKQLQHLTTLELPSTAPELLKPNFGELAVPGTVLTSLAEGTGEITIQGFNPQVSVISSKQRPRKIVIVGSDGNEHVFLLKGHEDLRQDERVMQLFGLVNELLGESRDPNISSDLFIKRFAVVPLSHNSGLISWVPNCDTLHSLVRDYRDHRKILLNVEHRLMLQAAPQYEQLSLENKVEVFEYALSNSTGLDIKNVLWLKSRNSEIWLHRRTNYIRSLATMSMVGYVLGLGDRHPSNLMLEKKSGKILHIDFGDCFEVAMNREKYPEKIPFRLTRMLVTALEPCGVAGFYRKTCEGVMSVLRENKESVMAMLEAFLYDPLINWRLIANDAADGDDGRGARRNANRPQVDTHSPFYTANDLPLPGASIPETLTSEGAVPGDGSSLLDQQRSWTDSSRQHAASYARVSHPTGSLFDRMQSQGAQSISELIEGRRVDDVQSAQTARTYARTLAQVNETVGAGESEEIDQRAARAIQRVENKLTGRDMAVSQKLEVPDQVQRLINEAKDVENLCQCYTGWCAFW